MHDLPTGLIAVYWLAERLQMASSMIALEFIFFAHRKLISYCVKVLFPVF